MDKLGIINTEICHMTEEEKQQLLSTIFDCICADEEIKIGPVLDPSKLGLLGIWVLIMKVPAYFGKTFQAAMLTAQLSDWWILPRDGKMLIDDIEWIEERATLGENWEQKEIPMFKEERRIRLAFNIQLATSDDPDFSKED